MANQQRTTITPRATSPIAQAVDDSEFATLWEIFEVDPDSRGWLLDSVKEQAKSAGVDLPYAIRAAVLFLFMTDHREAFQNDPKGRDFRMPTPMEEHIDDVIASLDPDLAWNAFPPQFE